MPTSLTLSVTSVALTALGDTVRIDATVLNQSGDPMAATVTWTSSDESVTTVAAGLVTAVGNGPATVTATSGAVDNAASVEVAQAADPSVSTVAASPDSLPANGTSTSTLAVQLADARGNALTVSGGTVAFDPPSSGSIGPVTDHGDGSYTATYTSGTAPETVTIVPRIDGAAFTIVHEIRLSPTFYLAENGVTAVCPDAAVGDSGSVGGIAYTKRSRTDLDALFAAADYIPLETSCTTGVTDMSELFAFPTPPNPSFNPDLRSWDVSSVTDMRRHVQKRGCVRPAGR